MKCKESDLIETTCKSNAGLQRNDPYCSNTILNTLSNSEKLNTHQHEHSSFYANHTTQITSESNHIQSASSILNSHIQMGLSNSEKGKGFLLKKNPSELLKQRQMIAVSAIITLIIVATLISFSSYFIYLSNLRAKLSHIAEFEHYLHNIKDISTKVTKPEGMKDKIELIQLKNGAEIILITPQETEKNIYTAVPTKSKGKSLIKIKTIKDEKSNSTVSKSISLKSVISLVVDSGSIYDGDIFGLAHFTEHLLFLGSKKYPDESLFHSFMKRNSGYYNGYTEKEKTTYAYEIDNEALLGSLEIFLSAITQPQFSMSSIIREVNAVQAEFDKNSHLEDKIFYRLYVSLASKNSPFRSFSTGDKRTLDIETHPNIKSSVEKYYKDRYTGSNVKAVIYTSSKETATIKHTISSLLSSLPRSTQPKNKEEVLKNAYTAEEKSSFIFYLSTAKVLKLMYFIDASENSSDDLINQSNPRYYLAKLINESPFLNSKLILEKLLFSYKAELYDRFRKHSSFSISFFLTEKGMKNVIYIISTFQLYIDSLHSHLDSKAFNLNIKSYLEGTKREFNSRPFIPGFKNVKKLSSNFHHYGAFNLFIGDEYVEPFVNPNISAPINNYTFKNPSYNNATLLLQEEAASEFKNRFHKVLSEINISNSIYFLGASSFTELKDTAIERILQLNGLESNESFLKEMEEYFGLKYSKAKISEDLQFHFLRDLELNITDISKSLLNSKKASAQSPTLVKKQIPALTKNETNISICKGNSTCEKETMKKPTVLVPKLAYKSSINQLYYQYFNKHLTTEFTLSIQFFRNYKIMNENNKNFVFLRLLVLYLNHEYTNYLTKLNNSTTTNKQTIDLKKIGLVFKDNYLHPLKPFLWSSTATGELRSENYNLNGLFLECKFENLQHFNSTSPFQIIRQLIADVHNLSQINFDYFKEELIRYLDLYRTSNPVIQAQSYFYKIGFTHHIDYYNLTSTVKEAQLNEFFDFTIAFFKESYMKSLVYGNTQFNEAVIIGKLINSEIAKLKALKLPLTTMNVFRDDSNQANKKEKTKKTRVFEEWQEELQYKFFNLKGSYVYSALNTFSSVKNLTNSGILNCYLLGPNDETSFVKLGIIEEVGSNIFFSFLRTQHQLGYSIKLYSEIIQNSIYIMTSIQSTKNLTEINKLIDEAFSQTASEIEKMSFTDELFNTLKQKYLKKISKDIRDLDQMTHTAFGNLLGEERFYNRAQFKDFSAEEIATYIRNNLVKNKLSIQIYASTLPVPDKNSDDIIEDPELFSVSSVDKDSEIKDVNRTKGDSRIPSLDFYIDRKLSI